MCRRADGQPDKRFRSSVSLTSSSTSPSALRAPPPSSPPETPAQSPPDTESNRHLLFSCTYLKVEMLQKRLDFPFFNQTPLLKGF